MNLRDLIDKTASQHREFKALFDSNLDEHLQQFILHDQADSKYDACAKVLETILVDSIGSMVETWLARED